MMFDKLFEVLQWAFEALVPFVILQPYEGGVLTRFGKTKRVLGPGFHWCLPFHFDVALCRNVVPRTTHISGLSTTTKDGRGVGFDAIVTWEIEDVQKAILDVDDVMDAITDACAGEIGTRLSEEAWEDIYQGKALGKLTAACRRRGKRWGLNVIEVQLAGVSLVKNIRIMTSGSHNVPDVLHMH